jgi:hypothetical protein
MNNKQAASEPLPPESHPLLDPQLEHRVTFHMAEFSALEAEIAEMMKAASTNLQYALAASGGITAWLLSAKAPKAGETLLVPAGPDQLRYAFLLPLLLSVAFGTIAAAASRRIGDKVEYLKLLEDWLRAAGLGSERRSSTAGGRCAGSTVPHGAGCWSSICWSPP